MKQTFFFGCRARARARFDETNKNAGKPPSRRDRTTKGKKTMNDRKKKKPAPEGIKNAFQAGDLIFLRRIDWSRDEHPKLHALLSEMLAADETPLSPAPVIEIQFNEAALYYIVPECIADFALRIYSDYLHRRPPFTQERLDALFQRLGSDPATLRLLEQILFGGDDPDTVPLESLRKMTPPTENLSQD